MLQPSQIAWLLHAVLRALIRNTCRGACFAAGPPAAGGSAATTVGCCSNALSRLTLLQGRSLNMPDFKWTGDLRPARIGPMRPVSVEGRWLAVGADVAAQQYSVAICQPPAALLLSRELSCCHIPYPCWPPGTPALPRLSPVARVDSTIAGHSLQIPDHIPKPDYYLTGYPTSEMESRQQHAGAPLAWHFPAA